LNIDFPTVITKFDAVLARGLSVGIGQREGQMCLEAALCAALDLPHGDDPECVTAPVRVFTMRLNDSTYWSSPASRAQYLRTLGIAQVGSKGVVDSYEFSTRLAKAVIQHVLPRLFQSVFPGQYMSWVTACKHEGTETVARELARTVYDTVDASTPVRWEAVWAAATAAQAAAQAAKWAKTPLVVHGAAESAANAVDLMAQSMARSGNDPETYLRLGARVAFTILRELGSPGCAWV